MYQRLNRALCASTALATGLLLATGALAQSTGSATVEELVVTGANGPRSMEGIIEQTAPKTKTTIDQEYIARQMPGQAVTESLNVVPGYNFTNNDAYGNSGGNLRVRSYDCNRISFQWDGIQLNDSGNYACFSNQLGDSEVIASTEVSQGTTDVDSPTASATGGAINYRTKVPDREMGGHVNLAAGSLNYYRGYGEFDSGEVGPWGTRMFVAGSYTEYDKFRGVGELKKTQFNARVYQPIRDNGDFASLAFHYNKNRNNSYFNPTLAQYNAQGYKFDNDFDCTRPTPVGGTAQNEATQSTIVNSLGNIVTNTTCSSYFNTRINPSNTANVRGQFKYHLLDNLIFTFDPSFQYVLANGGGFSTISETDGRVRGTGIVTNATTNVALAGTAGGPGRDLNGDGDSLDTVAFYTPNNTNTRRYGLNSSLIWDINETNHVRLAYSLDYARHRQTAEWSPYDAELNPLSVFAGKDGHGPTVATNDGPFLRGRDRFSIAQLNMFAAEYLGRFVDDKLEVRAGIRAPFFKRDLNQFCFSQNGSSNVLCTTQPTLLTVGTTTLTNGNVFIKGQGTTQYIRPYSKTVKYDKLLPNVGVSYKITDQHSVYASYAKGFGVPRTDNLYTVTRAPDGSLQNPGVEPETADTFEAGYRFYGSNVQVTLSVYDAKFKNRIASSFDQLLGTFTDRNIGDVDIKGFDGLLVWQPVEKLSYTGSLSYNDSEVQSDSPLSGGLFLPIKGKKIVETPTWTSFNRVQWDVTELVSGGVQMKYVGKRYSTDVNDQYAKAYTTWDADVRVKLPYWGGDRVYLQANVKNLTDKKYFGSISSQTNSIAVPGSSANQPTYALGSPRTYQFSLHVDF
ncbi:MAG: TonB-dependent receptor [Phenylobacterium sp.]